MVLKLEFNKEFEQKFRELAMRRHGFAKGSIKKASEEAIKFWMREQYRSKPKVKDPFKLIEGILSKYKGKQNSVELQHEASKLWIK